LRKKPTFYTKDRGKVKLNLKKPFYIMMLIHVIGPGRLHPARQIEKARFAAKVAHQIVQNCAACRTAKLGVVLLRVSNTVNHVIVAHRFRVLLRQGQLPKVVVEFGADICKPVKYAQINICQQEAAQVDGA
jgi:hypothetical protein